MSLIRGFDRIFLILSILSIFPVFYLLPNITRETLKKVTVEYINYDNKIKNDIKSELAKLSDDEVLKWKKEYYRKQFEELQSGKYYDSDILADSYRDRPRQLYGYIKYRELISKAPAIYKYPSNSMLIFIIIILAIVEAVLLFFILKGTTRLIKWVVDGFKNI